MYQASALVMSHLMREGQVMSPDPKPFKTITYDYKNVRRNEGNFLERHKRKQKNNKVPNITL